MSVAIRVCTLIVVIGLTACGGGTEPDATPTVAETPTRTPIPASPTPEVGEGYERLAPSGESQVIDGLTIIVDGAALTSPERLYADEPSTLSEFRDLYPSVRSIVVVSFIANNRSSTTQSILAYVGTTGLLNDEQLEPDLQLSTLESDILAGASVDMLAVFLSERYTSSQIDTVRMTILKELALGGDKMYDFTIPVE